MPARSEFELPALIPPDSMRTGIVPESAAATAARRAAGPEPMMMRSQDSIVLGSGEPQGQHEDDARDSVPIPALIE